jgi:alpha-1,3-glucan synthase
VFPRTANVSTTLLHRDNDGNLYITQQAPGAEKFRYSTNFQSTFSDWLDYTGGNVTLNATVWSGTKNQEWSGEHVNVQYWSSLLGSSDHVQEGDLDTPSGYPSTRRWPHAFMMGPFNLYGFDAGIQNQMTLGSNGLWTYNFMADWPALVQVNLWGINPDGQPDQSYVYGDVDGDSILDRLPPSSLASNTLNITEGPTAPYLSWQIVINDGSRRFILLPQGSRHLQITMLVLMWIIPPITGIIAVIIFKKSFYQVCHVRFRS